MVSNDIELQLKPNTIGTQKTEHDITEFDVDRKHFDCLLSRHVQTKWNHAYDFKRLDIEPRLVEALRMYNGEYPPQLLSEIKKLGMSEIYIGLGQKKVIGISAKLYDTIFREKIIWDLSPTPLPDLSDEDNLIIQQTVEEETLAQIQPLLEIMQNSPPESQLLMQQQIAKIMKEATAEFQEKIEKASYDLAKKKADKMSTKIYDEFVRGRVYDEISKFLQYYVRYSFAVLKFPVYKKCKVRKYTKDYDPIVIEEIIQTAEAVNPFDIYYPSDTTNLSEGEVFQRHKISKMSLQKLIGMKGYDEKAIRHLLSSYPKGYQISENANESVRNDLEKFSPISIYESELYDTIEFWGNADGKDLIEWGYKGKTEIDKDMAYRVNVWIINGVIIKAVLNPDDVYGLNPYFSESYVSNPDGVAGFGVMDIFKDIEYAFNAVSRSIINNAAFASGPISVVNEDMLPRGGDGRAVKIHPYQVLYKRNNFSNEKAIDFYQAEFVANGLIGVASFYQAMGDEVTIPKQSYGEGGGQTETASGMSMLQQAANVLLEYALTRIYENIIYPIVEMKYHYLLNMMTMRALKVIYKYHQFNTRI